MATRLLFIGVTTGASAIRQIFPRWRDALDLDGNAMLDGIDLPIGAPDPVYRAAVERAVADRETTGALVTTHKVAIYRAARRLFAWVDRYAALCEEVSCLAKRNGELYGWAKDPVTAGLALRELLAPGYFARTGGAALIFGAGGAGVAIALHLLSRTDAADQPRRLIVADRDASRLDHLRAIHERLEGAFPVEYAPVVDVKSGDELLAGLPARSLVINATGMGKDTPGSPIGDDAVFPEGAIAWELNYRGALDFLHQAWAQRDSRGVRVEDGWSYFIHGWVAVIAEVFGRPIAPDEIATLKDLAAFARPDLPTTHQREIAR